ncbi:MAG: isoprenylcysteine carboxylmethyltransferase family protein [Pseudomonadota bacterium]
MSLRRDFPDLPPIWALGLLTAQVLLTAYLPLQRFSLPIVGWVVFAIGLALAVWAAWWFWRKRTTIEPRDAPTTLIVEGPFRLNRNPIYSGAALCLLGAGIILGSLSALLMVPLFCWIVSRRFILEEEATLRAAFGEEADRYIAATRRW